MRQTDRAPPPQVWSNSTHAHPASLQLSLPYPNARFPRFSSHPVFKNPIVPPWNEPATILTGVTEPLQESRQGRLSPCKNPVREDA